MSDKNDSHEKAPVITWINGNRGFFIDPHTLREIEVGAGGGSADMRPNTAQGGCRDPRVIPSHIRVIP
jgi:hypothetical protein